MALGREINGYPSRGRVASVQYTECVNPYTMKNLVHVSRSYDEVLVRLGMPVNSKHRKHIKKQIMREKFNVDHFSS